MFSFPLNQNEKLIQMHRQPELILAKPVLLIMVLLYVPWGFLLKYGLATQFRGILLVWTILLLIYGINKYFL